MKKNNIKIEDVEKAFSELNEIDRDYHGYHRNPHLNPLGPSPKSWTKPPMSDEEKAIYDGLHLHTESSPFGLHSHIPGGKLSGAHTHSQAYNSTGKHHHQEGDQEVIDLDGDHLHCENHPDGSHKHNRFNFG